MKSVCGQGVETAARAARFRLLFITFHGLRRLKPPKRGLQVSVVEDFVALRQARRYHRVKKSAVAFQLVKFMAAQEFAQLVGEIIGLRVPEIQ